MPASSRCGVNTRRWERSTATHQRVGNAVEGAHVRRGWVRRKAARDGWEPGQQEGVQQDGRAAQNGAGGHGRLCWLLLGAQACRRQAAVQRADPAQLF